SGNGDEHSCNLGFSNDVEVVKDTGIMQPRTMTMQAKARGPSGYFTGRGWANCSYSGYITKY
ncbi:MAG: hypothetical protein U1C59_11335, partial [Methylotenera sp.]|nr:hypothetical protein [Methylotenera sp.]